MSSPIIDQVRHHANDLFNEIVAIRRRIHAHPELATNEHETAGFVAEMLRGAGIEVEEGVAGTGVIGFISGRDPGPCLLLRADMDALPIQEDTGLSFSSQIPGRMHACGHDAHTAALLGAALIIYRLRQHLRGSIRFIFQPAEERVPGGARPMIEDGVLNARNGHPSPTHAFAQHVSPELPAGTIGVRGGPYMASADEIYITIRGEGGHAAAPHHLAADTVLASAHVITALQSLVSRNAPPGSPSILSIGRVIADGATNVIPSECRMEGTFRAMNEEWRFRAHDLMRRIIEQTAQGFGASADVEIRVGYPALHNDPAEAARVRTAALNYVGEENTIDLDMWFASEDFAWFLQAMPGAFFRLGTGGTKATSHPLHTPRFTVDEEALRIGAGFMAYLALAYPDIAE